MPGTLPGHPVVDEFAWLLCSQELPFQWETDKEKKSTYTYNFVPSAKKGSSRQDVGREGERHS